ncbi:MAG: oligoribonuclease [Cellulomonadaceae bacterium]|jgi:oligoribonuclease|nr:oligoribonuclease [Cellulomonadaceae bacterium]
MGNEKSSGKIIWVDCEMTGLDPQADALLEIAVIVTDANLVPFDGGIDVIIKPAAEKLATMNDFVRDMHTKSGLLAELSNGVTLDEATAAVMDYVKLWVPEPGDAPLAGNSVGVDKAFLAVNMPQLVDFLHYRIIDVSTLKELAKRWYGRVWECQPEKATGHRALQDINESINELRYYREAMLVPPPGPTSEQAKAIAAQIVATSGAAANDLY